MKKINVLDKGYVELIDYMGDEYRVLESARISTGANAVKGEEKDRKLIRYLYTQEHLSVFEQVQFTFKIKAPIFITRQWFRHRTGSPNEASARYKAFEWETWEPDNLRIQDTKNKQSSNGEIIDSETLDLITRSYWESEKSYNTLLEKGIAREQARAVMPIGHYTEFFWTQDLRNILHLIKLRKHPHAQKEIQEYAQAVYNLIKDTRDFDWVLEVFDDVVVVQEAVQKKMRKLEGLDVKRFVNHINNFKGIINEN